MEQYFLYILYSATLDKYYIGISHDPELRLKYHNTSQKGWTRRGRPWRIVFERSFLNKAGAQYWESWIKRQKSKTIVEKIIRGEFDWQ